MIRRFIHFAAPRPLAVVTQIAFWSLVIVAAAFVAGAW